MLTYSSGNNSMDETMHADSTVVSPPRYPHLPGGVTLPSLQQGLVLVLKYSVMVLVVSDFLDEKPILPYRLGSGRLAVRQLGDGERLFGGPEPPTACLADRRCDELYTQLRAGRGDLGDGVDRFHAQPR